MNKTVKRLAALLAAIPLVLSLTGCNYLDELRDSHAFWDEDRNIVLQGVTYKKLPFNEYLCIDGDRENAVNVTEPDVPVLLSPFEFTCYRDSTGVFLEYSSGVYYCREDRYEDMVVRLKAPFEPEVLCYSYYVYDSKQSKSITHTYTLTQEQSQMLTTVMENTEPQIQGEGWSLNSDATVYLEEATADLLLRRECMRLLRSGSTYYISIAENRQTLVFTIPDGCKETCDAIMNDYDHRYDTPEETEPPADA